MALTNLRVVDDHLLTGKAHPVLSGLIETLPPAGAEFSAAARDAWVDMFRAACVLAYGPAGEKLQEKPMTRSAAPRAAAKRPARSASRPRSAPGKSVHRAKVEPAFYIDRQNFVRRRGGDRIMPHEVAGYIVDQRGMNGALETMTWADGSAGPPKGVSLDITVSDASDD